MPYYFFIWCIMHLGFLIVSIAVAAYLFSDDLTEIFREADGGDCPRRYPTIPGIILKLIVAAFAGYLSYQVLSVEILAIMISILLVPLTGLVLLASIFNIFELHSLRLFWYVTLSDILGAVAIVILGVMITSMAHDMFMAKSGLVLAAIYLVIKLAVHYDQSEA